MVGGKTPRSMSQNLVQIVEFLNLQIICVIHPDWSKPGVSNHSHHLHHDQQHLDRSSSKPLVKPLLLPPSLDKLCGVCLDQVGAREPGHQEHQEHGHLCPCFLLCHPRLLHQRCLSTYWCNSVKSITWRWLVWQSGA